MPRLPTQVPDVNLSNPIPQINLRLRDQAPAPDTSGSTALSNLGQQMEGFGRAVDQMDLDQQKLNTSRTAANSVANFDFTPTLLKMQTQAQPGAQGFTQAAQDAYQDAVQDHLDNDPALAADPLARAAVERELNSKLPTVTTEAAKFQVKEAASNQNFLTSQAVTSLDNKVRADPVGSYDAALAQLPDVIKNAPDTPEAMKPAMLSSAKSQLAVSRFDALGQTATDPDQIAAYVTDLKDPNKPWQSSMSVEAYNGILDKLKTEQKTLQTAQTTAARASLEGLKQMNEGQMVIPDGQLLDVGQLVRKTKDPALQQSYAELSAQQYTLKTYGAAPPSVIRDKITANQGNPTSANPNLPPALANPIIDASVATGGKVSSSYLAGTLARENRGMLAGQPAAEGNGGGAGQFIPSTWLNILPRLGVDTTGMSDDQKLALRSNVSLNLKATALYAADNKAQIESALGRPISDGELYFGHFLGPAGATSMLRAYQTDPNQSAVAVAGQKVADANKADFYNKDGSPKTVGQLYTNTIMAFSSGPGRDGWAANTMLRKMQETQTKGLSTDPMSYATNAVGTKFQPVDPQMRNPAAQGQQAMAIADFYEIPRDQMKPLTLDQADHIKQVVGGGTVDDQQAIMRTVSAMGPDMAKAAYKQIGVNAPAFSYLGALQQAGAAPGVVTDALKGMTRVRDDKTLDAAAPMKRSDMQQEFDQTFGPATAKMAPADKQAMFEAARAHYAETYAASNLTQPFNAAAFGKSMNSVLGAQASAPQVGNVNGAPTVVPPGITPQQFDSAVHKMTDADFLANSLDGSAPRFANGQVATAQQIQSEGKFNYVKGGAYMITMSNGLPLLGSAVANAGNTGVRPYYLKALPATMLAIAARKDAPVAVPEAANTGALP